MITVKIVVQRKPQKHVTHGQFRGDRFTELFQSFESREEESWRATVERSLLRVISVIEERKDY